MKLIGLSQQVVRVLEFHQALYNSTSPLSFLGFLFKQQYDVKFDPNSMITRFRVSFSSIDFSFLGSNSKTRFFLTASCNTRAELV